MESPILSLERVSMSYPGVLALDDVSLELQRGEVLGLVGENGAGKSTLIKIVAGVIRPDRGTIKVDGVEVSHADPANLIEAGVSAIYQEFSLFPELSVSGNFFYGRELKRGPFLDRKRMANEARDLLQRMGAKINPTTLVKDLSVGHQQLVEVAKAISRQARILIMDEPTAPLTNREVAFFYRAVRALTAEGVSIIYVSHRLEEIFDLCDRVMILRDGRHVHTAPTSQLSRDQLIEFMVGRTLDEEFPPSRAKLGPVVLEVSDLKSEIVGGVSFHVRAGEILGIGGLVGAGRTETARLIFGADSRRGGEIRIDGKVCGIDAPKSAIRGGIGLVPEDRKHHGALLGQDVAFNIVYAALSKISRMGFIRRVEEDRLVDQQIVALKIKTSSVEQDVASLSGGNQQKVVLAKWLLAGTKILIFDEPTRGVDVGAKHEIYKLMRALSDEGKAIVMISSEMPELMGMSDRIVVLHEGRAVATLEKDEFDQATILRYASGMGAETETQIEAS